MRIEGNTLLRIDPEDIIDGVFTAPDEVLYVGDNLYNYNNGVIKMILPNVIEIGVVFLIDNESLISLEMPKVEILGECFLFKNTIIESIYMPNIKEIGPFFLFKNAKFKYTPRIIKSLSGNLYISGERIDKTEYLRNFNIRKILC